MGKRHQGLLVMRKNEANKKLMSKELATLHGEPLSRARKLMLEKGLLHLTVVDKDHVVGMLTSRELLRNFAELYRRAGGRRCVIEGSFCKKPPCFFSSWIVLLGNLIKKTPCCRKGL